jgi:hypothetical protein
VTFRLAPELMFEANFGIKDMVIVGLFDGIWGESDVVYRCLRS